MNRRRGPRILTIVAVVTMVVSVIGVLTSLLLNAFVFDEFDAYGEVSIPGSSTVTLPAGEVTVTFHTLLISSPTGSGLPVPPLQYRFTPPAGVAEPQLTEDYGATTTVNNDARVRIGFLRVPVAGSYGIETDGNVGAYLDPRLAFGHDGGYGTLPIAFGVIFGLAVIDLIIARIWAARTRRAEPAVVDSFVPTDQRVRQEQLNDIARLRDSGAMSEAEFESEKKRILDGR